MMAVQGVIVFLLISVSTSQAHEGFDKFLELSGKFLPSNIGYEEKQRYYQVWKDNTQYIEEHNAMEEVTFKLGINKFTHLLPHQLPKSTPWTPKTNNDASFKTLHSRPMAAPPTEADWRVKGDVSAVHDQGQSGCDFEIVFADVVTSFHAIQTSHLIQFSSQQLIDCCTEDCRCNRLLEPGQLAICIKKHGGLCPDYSQNKTECECQKCNEDKFMIRGMREVPSGNETALQYAVATEPVMVAVDSSHQSFLLYRFGIYKEPLCSSTKLDHFMLVVGYGSEDGMDYWLCKNSFGVYWGMNGYMKIARNANNMCGIATTAYYPY